MSQKEAYEILKELGGTATISDIRKRAKEKYPSLTLHQYIGLRLEKLSRWGIIKRVGKDGYTIVSEFA